MKSNGKKFESQLYHYQHEINLEIIKIIWDIMNCKVSEGYILICFLGLQWTQQEVNREKNKKMDKWSIMEINK